MLNESQRAQLRGVLESERLRLLQNGKDVLNFSMTKNERPVGRDSIDESMEEELFSTELRLRDREKFLLGKVLSALERLEAGSIDECESCGEAIGFRRLLARPVTNVCIDCKEEAERQEESESQAARAPGRDELGPAGGSDDLGASSPEE